MAEKTALEAFKIDLENLKPKFQPLMKDDTDKFVQISCNYVESNQKLLDSTRPSLYAAIMKAAQCGLFIDGQEASLVPFSGAVTMMTGYKGILKMVRNSGELSSINAGVVYEKDTFEYYVDEKGEHITHRPSLIKERGLPTQTYCIARTKGNAEPYIEVMTEEEIENCKKQSAAVKKNYDTPWKGPFADEMRKKTVIRRISKRLPMSTDLNIAISSDDVLFNAPVDEPTPAPEQKTQSSSLEKAVGVDKTPPPATPAPAPVTQKDVEEVAKRTVDGFIATINVKDFPEMADPNKRRRYSCKIGEVAYGTWNLEIYKKIESFYDQKAEIMMSFMTLKNAKGVNYNEIIDVVKKVTDEDLPI